MTPPTVPSRVKRGLPLFFRFCGLAMMSISFHSLIPSIVDVTDVYHVIVVTVFALEVMLIAYISSEWIRRHQEDHATQSTALQWEWIGDFLQWVLNSFSGALLLVIAKHVAKYIVASTPHTTHHVFLLVMAFDFWLLSNLIQDATNALK